MGLIMVTQWSLGINGFWGCDVAELMTFVDNVTYDASDVVLTLETGIGQDGIMPDYQNNLNPTNPSSLTTTIDTGGAAFLGYRYRNTAALALTHAAATSGKMRYDLIVVRFNTVSGAANLTIIQGTDATSNPTIPSIVGGTDVLVATILLNNVSSLIVTVFDTRNFAEPSGMLLALAIQRFSQGAT